METVRLPDGTTVPADSDVGEAIKGRRDTDFLVSKNVAGATAACLQGEPAAAWD